MTGRPVDDLHGRLLIQCRLGQAHDVAAIATAHGGGMVLTGSSPSRTVHALRERGFAGPILCDADRYSGARRTAASAGISTAWTAQQHDLGLAALTDSGYLALDDWAGVKHILTNAVRQPSPVIAMLPLAARWFLEDDVIDSLIELVDAAGLPVAVAIEHSSDPFGTQYVVRGFLRLLRTSVPVLLLRSDVAALGALCHGALAAAVGTTTGLRHIYPESSAGGGYRPSVAAFVTPLLGYHKLERIEQIVTDSPDLGQLWPCDCLECAGRTPAQLSAAESPDRAAFRHSLHAQLELRDQILRPKYTRQALISSWHEHCSHALFVHQQLAELIPAWREPATLRSWFAMTHDPLESREGIPSQARSEQVLGRQLKRRSAPR